MHLLDKAIRLLNKETGAGVILSSVLGDRLLYGTKGFHLTSENCTLSLLYIFTQLVLHVIHPAKIELYSFGSSAI
jgi:hypothetical protein